MENSVTEDFVDYETEYRQMQQDPKQDGENLARGNYVAVHSSGFRDFFLKPELLRAIGDAAFEHPSEVQHETIPHAITGMDVLCQAKSGMGKTAVFVLSILQQLDAEAADKEQVAVECLCIAHTRELAFQIAKEFDRFGKYLPGIKVAVVFGGVSITKDVTMLKDVKTCPRVLIGTPGRLLALVRDKHLKLDHIAHFVLDECDKSLEQLDMRRDIQEIFTRTPKKKQVMFFSATMNKEMRELCHRFMRSPVEVSIDDERKLTLDGLLQYFAKLEEKEKNRKLSHFLDSLEFNQVIIFVKSIPRCEALARLLTECGFPAVAMHGGLPQNQRIEKYTEFKDFKHRILVATDLISRGIDCERVNLVINYDMPESSDNYLHRVGRAGRFGTKGLAIAFVSTAEDLQVLEAVQHRFEVTIPPAPEHIDASRYLNTSG